MPSSDSTLINARCVDFSQPIQSRRHSKASDMSKEWYEVSSEEFTCGFSEERQVHHMQAAFENIGTKYIVAPDAPTGFVISLCLGM